MDTASEAMTMEGTPRQKKDEDIGKMEEEEQLLCQSPRKRDLQLASGPPQRSEVMYWSPMEAARTAMAAPQQALVPDTALTRPTLLNNTAPAGNALLPTSNAAQQFTSANCLAQQQAQLRRSSGPLGQDTLCRRDASKLRMNSDGIPLGTRGTSTMERNREGRL